ncbi:hypothetical protein HK103_002913 [Boothiomyces macroporosus]|uniref:F-box domain-containing protein n=1 Tax=Boothiomyces macroporosus TaxID=261099 RepID=A0AAD5UCV3_9FUNG|nr:hypothetical protein HK103_002913 [Boothiomyces macroporosus]
MLPTEIWILVFQNLERSDLYTVRKVDKKFSVAALLCLESILRGSTRKSPQLTLTLTQDCNKRSSVVTLQPARIDKEHVYFRLIKNLNSNCGFVGLAKILLEMLKNIKLDLFDRDQYKQLTVFLKEGWSSMSNQIPMSLRPAYDTLFRHILKTFETICDRPGKYMDTDLQISLIFQTWRVVDVLAPRSCRDSQLCSKNDCCAASISVSLEREFHDGILDKSITSYTTLSDPTECLLSNHWEWNGDRGKIKSFTSNFEVRDGISVNVDCLSCGEDSLAVADIEVKAPLWWMMV